MNRNARYVIPWLLLLAILPPVSVQSGGIGERLRKGLVHERWIPSGEERHFADSTSIAYILGGGQESMIMKLETVGRLSAAGIIGKVLMLHRPGITEYSSRFGRNLSNDEWSLEKLAKEGIEGTNVEFVDVAPAVFSTLAEAREVTALTRSRGIRRLILVSSPHHTERVWRSFSHFNRDEGLDLYVYGSQEKAEKTELLSERLKLWLYRYFAIPADRLGRIP